ncbi:MAG: hypothetical protein EA394_06400 [Bacteroidia bacterium]|nr:MAG: hypothetical protein EA394_06400 [Bacteroidia bacterium]
MKLFENIIIYLFAALYLVFGLNFFFDFLPMPALEGNELAYFTLLGATGYMTAVKILELVVAAMLLFNFRRPLAYLLILPVSVNILMYDVFIANTLMLGLPMVLMNVFLIYRKRSQYGCLLK